MNRSNKILSFSVALMVVSCGSKKDQPAAPSQGANASGCVTSVNTAAATSATFGLLTNSVTGTSTSSSTGSNTSTGTGTDTLSSTSTGTNTLTATAVQTSTAFSSSNCNGSSGNSGVSTLPGTTTSTLTSSATASSSGTNIDAAFLVDKKKPCNDRGLLYDRVTGACIEGSTYSMARCNTTEAAQTLQSIYNSDATSILNQLIAEGFSYDQCGQRVASNTNSFVIFMTKINTVQNTLDYRVIPSGPPPPSTTPR